MRVCRFVLFFLAAVFFASCSRIDEVDINSFNQPDGEVLNGTVAVFGNVTTEMRQHRVTISPVHQWGDNQNDLPEINRVFVLCGNDTIPYNSPTGSTGNRSVAIAKLAPQDTSPN